MSKVETHPTDSAPVIRSGANGPEIVEMRWGLRSRSGRDEPLINIPAEAADVSGNRCLIPASDFELFTGAGHPKRRWKVTVKGEPLFFFAGIWQAASADWPESYALITTQAGSDLAPLTDRQPAVIRPSEAAIWLSDDDRAVELLSPLPSGSYEAEG